jgi:hypothetical protein
MNTHNKTISIKQHDLNSMHHTIKKLNNTIESLTWQVKAERMCMDESCKGCTNLEELKMYKAVVCDCRMSEQLIY